MAVNLFFLLAWILSAAFTVLIGAGIVTYLRRTWQLIRAEGEGSWQSQLLDSIDQVQTQLYSMSERLERLEQRLSPGDSGDDDLLPPANDV